MQIGTTLSQYLIEEQRQHPTATGEFTMLMNDIEVACKQIAAAVKKGQLAPNVLGSAGTGNIQGEEQKNLDIIANKLFLQNNVWRGHVAAMCSEEMDEIYQIPPEYPRGKYLLIFDPLDGSSNIDINGPIGTIFSILRSPSPNPVEEDFLRPGVEQICAGYVLYGSATMMVITTGHGTHGFTLDPDIGEFILTHADMKIPETASEYSINHSNRREWEAPVLEYVKAREAGKNGVCKKNYTLRWVGAMVMDVHRILLRGGMFSYPIDERTRAQGGRLRILYEANPMAFLVEQAGGIASTGYQRILDIKPTKLHQRIPVMLGSKNELYDLLKAHKKYALENNLEFHHKEI
ncbi:fructose-1,6-bisphosphatase I [Gammaproteobacteria bacterium]|nr:fructose-1,6-bisphosphatase I [Gammaproteobacteria bacterium]